MVRRRRRCSSTSRRVQVADDRNLDDVRFPVQWVIRDHDTDYRGYAGQVAGGILRPGDEVAVLPSGARAADRADRHLRRAGSTRRSPPMSVTLLLDDDVDISRGDLICAVDGAPSLEREVEADVCWMTDAPLRAGGRYAIKHATHAARAIVDEVLDRVDVHTLPPDPGAELALNDIGRVRLRTSKPLAFDPYARNRATGAFILIDEATNDTVGAGMIR